MRRSFSIRVIAETANGADEPRRTWRPVGEDADEVGRARGEEGPVTPQRTHRGGVPVISSGKWRRGPLVREELNTLSWQPGGDRVRDEDQTGMNTK